MSGKLRVYDLAHCRAGDKGNTSNISVIAYEDRHYPFLREHLTPERVMRAFAGIAKGPVTRYELPNLRAFNFVIENALGGGRAVRCAAPPPRRDRSRPGATRRAGHRA